ncbi:MAG: hypothetical protein QNJ23_08410 [Woeseiaceae bacterium]|nr:hypothetical protein [Woeseiaceae bacterium]
MMISNSARKPANLTESQQMTRDAGRFMARKIWLPKAAYDALPLFYIIAGLCALLATFYISGWAWLLPHYLLFAVACLHLGFLIYRRRRHRKS